MTPKQMFYPQDLQLKLIKAGVCVQALKVTGTEQVER